MESDIRPRFPDSNVLLSDLLGCSGVRSRSSLRLASYATLQGIELHLYPNLDGFRLELKQGQVSYSR